MRKRKASFYGVSVGVQPGVYDEWEDCKQQVDGFPGCRYKGFSTRAEAEEYVKGFWTGYQNTEVPTIGNSQSQANTNPDESCNQHPLPTATTKRNTVEPCLQRVRTMSPLQSWTRVTTSKKEVTTSPSDPLMPPAQVSTKDPSDCYKVIEENGQRFVVFESIKKFDYYFESLCRTRQSGRSWNLKPSCGNQEIRSQEQTSDSQDLDTQVTVEDDEFVYFKNEDDLKRFLEPYFKNAMQNLPGPAQVPQSFDVVPQASFDAQQGVYLIEFDGASKGNPGQAGAGALVRCPHGSVVLEMTQSLGIQTNNVAEYQALILGLKGALSKGMKRVRAQGDSKLVCLQVTSAWKVENKTLISLHKEVKDLEKLFEEFSIAHVVREYNSAADALANEAIYLTGPAREVAKSIPLCCA